MVAIAAVPASGTAHAPEGQDRVQQERPRGARDCAGKRGGRTRESIVAAHRVSRRTELVADGGCAVEAHEGASWEWPKPAPGRVGPVVYHASVIPVLCRQIEFQLQEVHRLGSVFCRPKLYLELEGRPVTGRGHLDQLGLWHRALEAVGSGMEGNGAEDSLGFFPGYHPGCLGAISSAGVMPGVLVRCRFHEPRRRVRFSVVPAC
jgi:hypothetical protein